MQGFSSDLKGKHQTLITVIKLNPLLLVCFVIFLFLFFCFFKKLTLFAFPLSPDSLGAPFPSTSHRCHHKPKRCLPIQCGNLPISPLLFHPNAKGSLIVMDLAQKTVKRLASFCNAITFSNRPIALYEQVRLKVFSTETNHCPFKVKQGFCRRKMSHSLESEIHLLPSGFNSFMEFTFA